MINSVRNTVLSVLNKNNYGYISPSDFNLYALQAQLEVYEEYFSNYNKVINAENVRTSGTDYADIRKAVAETMESFLVSNFLIPFIYPSGDYSGKFYVPSLITTGDEAYMINKLICYPSLLTGGSNTSLGSYQLINSGDNFVTKGVSIGDIVVNQTTYKSSKVTSVTTNILNLNDDIFLSISDDYAVYSSSSIAEAERVSSGKITMLNNSLLTTPNDIYPAYVIVGDKMDLYPSTIQEYGAVNAIYFRYPKVPKWTYSTLSGGAPVFDQSQPDYQDFEMPAEDEFKLVMKILQYCGVSIREGDISNFGMAQEQHEQPTFSQQQ